MNRVAALLTGLMALSFGSPLVLVALTSHRLSMGANMGPVFDWGFVLFNWALSAILFAGSSLATYAQFRRVTDVDVFSAQRGLESGLKMACGWLVLPAVLNVVLIGNPSFLVVLMVITLGIIVPAGCIMLAWLTMAPALAVAQALTREAREAAKPGAQKPGWRLDVLLALPALFSLCTFAFAYANLTYPPRPSYPRYPSDAPAGYPPAARVKVLEATWTTTASSMTLQCATSKPSRLWVALYHGNDRTHPAAVAKFGEEAESHSVVLGGLAPDTTYQCVITAKNARDEADITVDAPRPVRTKPTSPR